MDNRIDLIKENITKLNCDAIVNAANKSLLGGGGVDGAIHRAGGKEILKECKEIGGCDVGEAVITTGGDLNSKYVIHTVGPVWRGGNNNEEEMLKKAYLNSLKLAVKKQIKMIAFPNISTGVYRFPKEKSADIAVKTVNDFLSDNDTPEKVIFVCYDEENHKIYQKLLKSGKI